MPSRIEHIKHCVNEIGEGFDELHKWMDTPSQILRGAEHRQLRHNPLNPPAWAVTRWGLERTQEAMTLHTMLDGFGVGELTKILIIKCREKLPIVKIYSDWVEENDKKMDLENVRRNIVRECGLEEYVGEYSNHSKYYFYEAQINFTEERSEKSKELNILRGWYNSAIELYELACFYETIIKGHLDQSMEAVT